MKMEKFKMIGGAVAVNKDKHTSHTQNVIMRGIETEVKDHLYIFCSIFVIIILLLLLFSSKVVVVVIQAIIIIIIYIFGWAQWTDIGVRGAPIAHAHLPVEADTEQVIARAITPRLPVGATRASVPQLEP